MKTIFLGTGEFAVPILEKISKSADWNVFLVVAQLPKPSGRGGKIKKSPIHKKADQLGLKTKTPQTLKDFTLPDCDIIITAAYGKIIPPSVFNKPKHKTVNVHPSLLPKLRGPSPIQWALLGGSTETGVSLMLIDEELDHGPLISQEEFKVLGNETYDTLEPKLANLGAEMIIRDVPKYVSGNLLPKEQSHDQATYSKIIKKEDGQVNWSLPAEQIFNKWRAFVKWPELFGFIEEKGAKKRLNLAKIGLFKGETEGRAPGTLFAHQKSLLVQCGDGLIEVLEIQIEGKKPMPAKDFVNGYRGILDKKFI